MKSIQEIHEAIDRVIDGLESGRMKPPVAVEINNAIGKKIGLIKAQLEYDALRNKLGDRATAIPLLDGPKG